VRDDDAFEQASAHVSEEDVARTVPCGPDPESHVAAARPGGFFRFYEREVIPHVATSAAAVAGR
jgi:hypothetical protein